MSYLLFSLREGKNVGINPLLDAHDEAERQREGPPTVAETAREWSICGMKLMNRDTASFADPTVDDCIEVTRKYFRALVWRKPDAVDWVTRRRKFEVDPTRTPWSPRPEYVEMLRNQGRLSTVAADPSTRQPSALDAQELLNDALRGGRGDGE